MEKETEEKWQEKWAESKIFEPSTDPDKEKFFITVPWPYVNGSLHVGHGRTYTLADIIARYKRSEGYNVLFPMAFHQSGTPILAFSQRLRMGDPSTIKLYRDYILQYESEEKVEERLKSFEEPKNIADYFSKAVISDFRSLGYSIDWTRIFTSADQEYQEFVRWQFEKLNSLGLIKKGSYPVLYSKVDDNAVGEDDIKDGDTDKVSIEEFTGVIFKGNAFSLIAASLRPETIFGITNIWIGKELDYVVCRFSGNSYVVTKESFQKLKLQIHDAELIREVPNSEILAQEYEVPETGKKVRALETTFVDPDNGTGAVYSVPGHSIWDYVALDPEERENIPRIIEMPKNQNMNVEGLVKKLQIQSVNDREKLLEATQILYKEEFYNGFMNNECGQFAGMSVNEAREKIKETLLSEGKAIKFLETSRKAETRSGSKVVVAVLQDQWFIDYSPDWLKKKAHDLVNSMYYYPEYYRAAMNDAVDWLRERPCARRRGLGTRLPFDDRWIIESLSDSTIYPAVYTCIQELKNIYAELGKIPGDVTEYIFSSGDEKLLASYSEAVAENCNNARKHFTYWYGVDIRLTAYPHLSNHLSFYVMNHAALFKEPFLPKGLIISGLVVSNGAKISKSKGNVISLMTISNHYSADIYRLYVAIQADIQSTLDWNENDLRTIIKKYDSLRELFARIDLNKNVNPSYIDLWFLARFNRRMEDFRKNMGGFNIRAAYVSIFYEVLNDIRRLEARGGDMNTSMKYIIREWLVALSAAIPHVCEELWHEHVEDSFVSSATLTSTARNALNELFSSMKGELEKIFPAELISSIEGNHEKITDLLLSSEEYISGIENDIREIIRATGISPKGIDVAVPDDSIIQASRHLINNERDSLMPEQKRMIPEFMKVRKNISFHEFDEYSLLSNNSEYLGKVFSATVKVKKTGPVMKGKNPWPGRPLIRLE